MGLLETVKTRIANYLDPTPARTITSLTRQYESIAFKAEESINALQQIAREDRGWLILSAEYDRFLTRDFIGELVKVARLYFLKNPIIRRGVLLQAYYVFGRSVEIRCVDETQNATLQAFLKANKKYLGTTGLTETEQDLQNSGNLFYALFTGDDGKTIVKTIDPLEIADIACDPDDVDTHQYYKRTWNQVVRSPTDGTETSSLQTAWYPALGFDAKGATTFAGATIQTGVVVYHRKVGAPAKSKWGYPETFAALDWADAVRRFLTSWLGKEETLSRLALQIKTPGGAQAIDAVKSSIETTMSGSNFSERNPSPQTGSAWVGGVNQSVNAIKTSGSNTSPDEARRALLMAIMLFGPETFFGDSQAGSLATAKSLDRPTELKFLMAQTRWVEDLQVICGYALAQDNANRALKTDTSADVLISFPDILEHDVAEMVGAIVDAATLKGLPNAGIIDQKTLAALLSHTVGLKNVSPLVEALYPQKDYKPVDWAAASNADRREMAAQIATAAGSVANAGGPQAESARTLEGHLLRLIEAMDETKKAA